MEQPWRAELRCPAEPRKEARDLAEDPFDRSHAPPVGVVEHLAPGLRVVTAPNAGPMTFTGTRSYLVGAGEVAVIDPGPEDPGHLDALVGALEAGERVTAVLVTHAHRDHSAGARALAVRTGAPVLAHGHPAAWQSAATAELAAAGALGGGEGVDRRFRPDHAIGEGAVVSGPGWTLTALHTPGHLGDHLSFAWAEAGALFTGDTVMGWATTLISPPEGELGAFRSSLERLLERDDAVYYPGHGADVRDPRGLVRHILAHRAAREQAIVAALGRDPATVADLVAEIYRDTDPVLRPAAARNVLAHLIDLVEREVVAPEGALTEGATFRLA